VVHRIFDDIGGMFNYALENKDLAIETYYVHDYGSKEWLDASDAYFVKSRGLLTPMSFGLAACAQRLEAESLAQEWNGQVLTFAELQDEFQQSIVQHHEWRVND